MSNKRLFSELFYIIANKKVTAEELSKKFEVSVRTIYPDINSLCSSGIPIYTTIGRNGGIQILDGFLLEAALLTKEEQINILAILQEKNISNNFNFHQLIIKLNGLFNLDIVDWIEIDNSAWSNDNLSKDKFFIVKEAIFDCKMISFDYRSVSQESSRIIHPYKLLYKNYNWYVQGFCTNKNKFRLFKLSRLTNIEITKNFFKKDKILPVVSTFVEENLINMKLKFDKSIAFRVYDEFPHSKITETDDAIYVVSELPDNDRLYSYILSFTYFVEIIEPKHMSLKIKNIAENLIKVYKT